MKFSIVVIVVVGLLSVESGWAQSNLLNAKTPEEIGEQTLDQLQIEKDTRPLDYGYTDDRDVLWAKTTWEFIDIKQRANFPLVYPLDTNALGRNRRSLFQILVNNIKNGKIKHLYADSYFSRQMSFQELDATLHRADTLDEGYSQLNAGMEVDPQYVSHTDVDGADVQGFRIRGYWYFDSRQGDLRYRLIGIAPVVTDAYSKSQGLDDAEPVELFWVFYPEIREIMFHKQVFNEDNTARPLNFDHLLNSRRFSAVIYKVDNDNNDRAIKDYIGDNSMMQLLESEQLKEEIREFEINMWNY